MAIAWDEANPADTGDVSVFPANVRAQRLAVKTGLAPPGVPTPPAIDLIDDACLYIKAPMDEVDAPKLHAGQTVRISLDALPKQAFAGKVRRVITPASWKAGKAWWKAALRPSGLVNFTGATTRCADWLSR